MFESSYIAVTPTHPPASGLGSPSCIDGSAPSGANRSLPLVAAKASILVLLYGCGTTATVTSHSTQYGSSANDARTAEARAARTPAPQVASLPPEAPQESSPAFPIKTAEPLLEAVREVDPDSIGELVSVFEEESYSLANVRIGNHGVPRLLVRRLPADYAAKLQGRKRKAAFIRAVLPLVLEANREILADRRRLIEVAYGERPSETDREWLASLAARYKVADPNDTEELLLRVDAIPASLAIAQAALESGWGTSRFARKGNALFGQWTWKKGAGIAPSGVSDTAKFSIRKFDSLYGAVVSYMNNLNVSSHYTDFREKRAELTKCHAAVTGTQLTSTLTRYSIEREDYVRKLESLLRFNRLHEFDTAVFRSPDTPFRQTRLTF